MKTVFHLNVIINLNLLHTHLLTRLDMLYSNFLLNKKYMLLSIIYLRGWANAQGHFLV